MLSSYSSHLLGFGEKVGELLPTLPQFPSPFAREIDHVQGSRADWPHQGFDHNLGFHVHRMVFPKTPTWLLPLSTGFLLKCCFLRETFPNLNQPCLHPSHSGPPYPASPPSSHGSHSLTLYYRSSCLLSTSITGM